MATKAEEYLAKEAIAASPWLQRESGAEVMLDRGVHGGDAPRLNRSSAERRQMGTGQRCGCANPLRDISSDIARLGKARLRRRLPLRLALLRLRT